jgi:hypothetical protein
MGRTIPSFRIALAMEKEDWKPFRNALDKKGKEGQIYFSFLHFSSKTSSHWLFAA